MNAKLAATAAGVAVVAGAAIFVLLGDPEPTTGLGRPSPGGGGPGGAASPEPGADGSPIDVARPVDGSGGGDARSGGGSDRPPPTGGADAPSPAPTATGRPAGDPRTTPLVADDERAVVTFLALDAEGQRLPGVRVETRRQSGMPLEPVVTDSRGEAKAGGIPRGESITGEARHPRFDPVSFGPVELGTAENTVELRFRAAQLGALRGRIVDDRGEPVTAAELVLKDPRQEGAAVLDAVGMGLGPDGSFYAQVAAGKLAVSARGDGLSRSDTTYVTVEPGGEADAGTLTVPRQGVISGKVTLPPDLTTVLPVEVDLVAEVTRGSERNPLVVTRREPIAIDASFTFALEDCDPGRYRIRLEVPEAGGNRVGAWTSLELEPGQSLDGVALALKEVQASIRGTVRDDRGDPVEGATVSVRGRTATTDRGGRYTLHGLDMGNVAVEVQAEGLARGYRQLTYEGAELVVDFELDRTGGVQGLVRGADGPAAGAVVQVVQKLDGGGVRPHQATTDGNGLYRLEGLEPGSYYLKAGRGADPFSDAGAPAVEVLPGEVVDAPEVALP